MLVEKVFDLLLIFSEDLMPLTREGFLDLSELLREILPSFLELLAHDLDQGIDIVVLLPDGLNILIILFFQLQNKLFN